METITQLAARVWAAIKRFFADNPPAPDGSGGPPPVKPP
ncbi:MAG: hypothetical protein RL030_1728 [Pseudomonadota bacterium]|jgi:hypothetical protein